MKKVSVSGNANNTIIGNNNIVGSHNRVSFNTSEAKLNELIKVINNHSASEDQKNELLDAIKVLNDENSKSEKKSSAMELIKIFLLGLGEIGISFLAKLGTGEILPPIN